MITTIHDTITEAVSLPPGAEQYLEPILDALAARENAIAQSLLAVAEEIGLPMDKTIATLADAGMEFLDPDPTPVEGSEPADQGQINAKVAEVLDGIAGVLERMDARLTRGSL